MLIGVMLLCRPADMSRLTNVQHQTLKGITHRPATIRSFGGENASPFSRINSSAFSNLLFHCISPNMHRLRNSSFWNLSPTSSHNSFVLCPHTVVAVETRGDAL